MAYKSGSSGGLREIKVLCPRLSRKVLCPRLSLKVDERRVQPRPSVGVRAHPTDEAITLEENLQQVDLETASPDGDLQLHEFIELLKQLF